MTANDLSERRPNTARALSRVTRNSFYRSVDNWESFAKQFAKPTGRTLGTRYPDSEVASPQWDPRQLGGTLPHRNGRSVEEVSRQMDHRWTPRQPKRSEPPQEQVNAFVQTTGVPTELARSIGQLVWAQTEETRNFEELMNVRESYFEGFLLVELISDRPSPSEYPQITLCERPMWAIAAGFYNESVALPPSHTSVSLRHNKEDIADELATSVLRTMGYAAWVADLSYDDRVLLVLANASDRTAQQLLASRDRLQQIDRELAPICEQIVQHVGARNLIKTALEIDAAAEASRGISLGLPG